MAAYGQLGDRFRFYEIDPNVVQIARSYFSYLADCPAKVDIKIGDARLSMESEAPQGYDVLVLDAFNTTAMPVHLLTREAFEVYLKHLNPDGVIAVNVSSRHFDLFPVVTALARAVRHESGAVSARHKGGGLDAHSEWILMTGNSAFLDHPFFGDAPSRTRRVGESVRIWTDQYSSLLRVLRK